MPPASKTRQTNLKWEDEDFTPTNFWEEFVGAQQSLTFADAKLICRDGGFVRVHSAYLQALSPFFRACFQSQGESFGKIHDFLLPDILTAELVQLLQLLYYGSVTCANEAEVLALKSNLELFQISTDLSKSRAPVPSASEDKIRHKEPSKKKALFPDPSASKKNRGGKKRGYDDSDYEPTTDDEGENRAPKVPKIDGDDATWKAPNYDDNTWFSRESKRCQVCKKQHPDPAKASGCVVSHGKLRCYFCLTFRDDTESLFKHLRANHKKAEKADHLVCPFCNESVLFKTVSSHVISNHLSDVVKDNKADEVQVAATVKCTTPGKTPSSKTTPSSATPGTSKSKPNLRPGVPVVVLEKTPIPKKDKKKQIPEPEFGIEKKQHWYEIGGDGLVRVGDLDVTLRTKMPNGEVLVRRIQKKYVVDENDGEN